MSMTDPIADMLTRIRNANQAYLTSTEVPASNIKRGIADILKAEGYIRDYEVVNDGKQGMIKMQMRYGEHKERVITGIKRISKPGLRVYAGYDELPRVLGGLGIAVISTSQGLMTDRVARKAKLGGEVVCYVW
jgi:small subunit ribosomal protein S8